MSLLLEKSQLNITASEILINQHSLYAPSIHCAYYSCIQIMIHILIYELDISEGKIENEAKIMNGGTHILAQNKISQDITINKGASNATIFNRLIGRLKSKRHHSDYKEFQVITDYSKEALKEATEIRDLLLGLYPKTKENS